jgi:hypothetical protein
MCRAIDNGVTTRTAIVAFIVSASESDDPEAASYAVGAAVAVLCPEYSSEFKSVTG